MKKTMIIILLAIAASCFADTTYVSGAVSGVWDTSGSPYVVTGNIYIPAGDTLNVHSGVSVLFRDYYNLDVQGVLGDLIGDSLNPITFSGGSDYTRWEITFSEGDSMAIQISDCIFENGRIEWWWSKEGSMTIESCEFYHTTLSPYGCLASDCYFTGNSLITGRISCRNCLIADNSTAISARDWWNAGLMGHFVSLYNCTIANNTTAVSTDFPYVYGRVSFYNCIIYGYDTFDYDRVNILNCILSDSLPYDSTDSYFIADPMFVDPEHGDYHLRDSSMAIGLGDTSYFIPDHDLDGNLRPNPAGSMPDLGCYENPRAIADAISESPSAKPEAFEISAYPNPFNSAVRISIETPSLSPPQAGEMPQAEGVTLEIFDLNGRRVAELPEYGTVGAGFTPARNDGASDNERDGARPSPTTREFTWLPDKSLPSGVYLVRIETDRGNAERKITYLK